MRGARVTLAEAPPALNPFAQAARRYKTGPTLRGHGKCGAKRSVLTDRRGVPLGAVIEWTLRKTSLLKRGADSLPLVSGGNGDGGSAWLL
jgi:hypothetical protein